MFYACMDSDEEHCNLEKESTFLEVHGLMLKKGKVQSLKKIFFSKTLSQLFIYENKLL